jgi:hypothetical protein
MKHFAVYDTTTGALLREPMGANAPELAPGEGLVERDAPPFGCFWSPDARDYVADPACPVLSPAEQAANAALPAVTGRLTS